MFPKFLSFFPLRPLLALGFFICLLSLSGCGGGGGGDGSSEGRTTETALRLIHGSIDSSPLSLSIAGLEVTRGRFADTKADYMLVPPGPVILRIGRQNVPGDSVLELPVNFEKEVEYTAFVYGLAQTGDFRVAILADPIARPNAGVTRLRVLNTVEGLGAVVARSGAQVTDLTIYGTASPFIEVSSGAQTIIIEDRDGEDVLQVPTVLPDRGEVTVLVTGQRELGIIVARVYEDLD